MDGKRTVVTAPRIHYDEATLRVRGRGARTAEGKRIARRSKTPFVRKFKKICAKQPGLSRK